MPQTEIFDLYYILVELISGSILGSWFLLVAVFTVIGFLSQMSPYTIIFLLMMFTLVFGIGYAGALVAIPVFIIAFIYFIYNLINLSRKFV